MRFVRQVGAQIWREKVWSLARKITHPILTVVGMGVAGRTAEHTLR
jgi:hypothetical protein